MNDGLGLARSTTPCGTVWGHGGDTLGHHTLAGFSPDGRRSAVAVTTTQPGRGQDPSVPGYVTLFTDRAQIDLRAVCQVYGRPVPATSAQVRAGSLGRSGLGRL